VKCSPIILTIGHSTRTLDEFIALLKAHAVTLVVDVRTIPRSRHNPQFNENSLPDSLRKASIGYVHMAGLGGRRHAKHNSVNTGWRNASFRGYADYMQTPEFEKQIKELISTREGTPDRIDVRGSGAVALSSLAHRRRLNRSRNSHRGYYESETAPTSYTNSLRACPRQHRYVSGGEFVAIEEKNIDWKEGANA